MIYLFVSNSDLYNKLSLLFSNVSDDVTDM